MTWPPQQAPVVQCNRGFGWAFWLVSTVLVVFLPIAAIGSAQGSPWGALVGLAVGGGVAALFLLARALFLPRLTIDLAAGVLRTRRDTIPWPSVALVRFRREGRSGTWASFVDDRGKAVARMSIADTLYAVPTAEQWAALSIVVSAAARARGAGWSGAGGGSVQQGQRESRWGRRDVTLSAAEAAAIMQAQAEWCLAGHRSAAGAAPSSALEGASITLE